MLIAVALFAGVPVLRGSPADAQAARADLAVLDAGGNPVGEIVVPVGPGSTTGFAQLKLLFSGSGTLDVSELTFTVSGATGAVGFANNTASATLTPGEPVGFRLDVSGVDRAGVRPGSLSVKVGSTSYALTDVKVDRRGDKPLEIDGHSDKITLPSTAVPDRTIPLTLTNEGLTTLTDIKVGLASLSGPDGQVQVGVDTAWPDQAAPSTLASGKSATITLKLTLPRSGPYQGKFDMSAAGLVQTIEVDVTRTDEKIAELVGAGDGYSFTSNDNQTVVGMSVANNVSVPVTDVVVQVSDLLGPRGLVHVDSTFGGQSTAGPQTLPPGLVKPIVIAADLPVAGDYTGTIRVSIGGGPGAVSLLKITREVKPTDATIAAGPTSFTATVSRSTQDVRLVVTNTGGGSEAVCISLVSVRPSKDGSEGSGTVTLQSVEVLPTDRATDGDQTAVSGSTVPGSTAPRTSPPASTNRAASTGDAATNGVIEMPCDGGKVLALPPRIPVALVAHLDNVPAPGEYLATFSVGDGSRSAVTADATVTGRYSAFYAASAVFVGAAGGYLFGLVPLMKTKTKRRRQLAFVRGALARATDPEVADVVAAMSLHLGTVPADLGGSAANVLDSLALQCAVLPFYTAACRLVLDKGVTRPSDLDAARVLLKAPAMTTTQRDDANNKISAALQAIALGAAHKQEVDSLQDLHDRLQRASIDLGTPDQLQAEINAAKAAIDQSQESALTTHLASAHRELRAKLGLALGAAGGQNEPPINTVPEPARTALATARTSALAQLPVIAQAPSDAAAYQAYEAAAVSLVDATAGALSALADAWMVANPGDPNNHAPQFVNYDLAKAAAQLVLTPGSLNEKSARLAAARTAYATARGGQQQSFAAVLIGVVGSLSPSSSGSTTLPVSSPAPDLSDDLGLGWDVLLAIVSALLAAALGVQAQWSGNATWGHLTDFISAVVWGLAGSTITYAGARPLLQKVTGTEPSS